MALSESFLLQQCTRPQRVRVARVCSLGTTPQCARGPRRDEANPRELLTPLPKPYVEIGRTSFGGLASYYEKDVPTVFAKVQDAQLQADFRAANQGAIKAAKEMDAWFASQAASATD